MKTVIRNFLLIFVAGLSGLLATNAQTPTVTPLEREAERAAIKKLNAEAMGLFLQPTGKSLRVAREKFIVVQNFYLEIGEKRLAASTFIVTGRISHQLGEYADALENMNRAVALWREIGDKKWEAMTLVSLFFIYDSLGEDEKALEISQQVLQLSRADGNKIGEGQALGYIGDTYFNRREYAKSLEHYQQALAIYQELGAGQSEIV